MKSAVLLLCLLVATKAAAAEPPRDTPEYRIREVRFAGDLAFDTDALKKVLKGLKVRRGIPGVWTRRPRYDARALDADLARLRAFYLSNGYVDVRGGIGEVTFAGREATITLQAQSGPKSRVRHVRIAGLEHEKTITDPNAGFPVDQLCKGLL